MFEDLFFIIFYLAIGIGLLWFGLFYTTKVRFMNHKAFRGLKNFIFPIPLINYWIYKLLLIVAGIGISVFGISLFLDFLKLFL